MCTQVVNSAGGGEARWHSPANRWLPQPDYSHPGSRSTRLAIIAVLGRASRARSLEQQENSPDRHSFAAAAAARERKPLRELELSGAPKAVAIGVERDDSTACGGRQQRGCACVSSTGLGGGEARLLRERAPPQPHHATGHHSCVHDGAVRDVGRR